MLPFRKKDDDGVGTGPVETLKRSPDEDSPYDMLDAIAEDISKALEKKDTKLLKGALEGLCLYIQAQVGEQDQLTFGDSHD